MKQRNHLPKPHSPGTPTGSEFWVQVGNLRGSLLEIAEDLCCDGYVRNGLKHSECSMKLNTTV